MSSNPSRRSGPARRRNKYPAEFLAGIWITIAGIVIDLVFHLWLISSAERFEWFEFIGHLVTFVGLVWAVAGLAFHKPERKRQPQLIRRRNTAFATSRRMPPKRSGDTQQPRRAES